jgi:hypothetical protein
MVDDLPLPQSLAPLSGNKAIEDAAIAFVMKLEREAGRAPQDRRYEAAFAADISSPPRIVEVKAVGGSQRGWTLWLEVAQVNEARTNPDFYVYVVDNVRQGDPAKFGLKVLGGQRLTRLLERAKERRYFEVPLPVAEYDTAPGRDALADDEHPSVSHP